MSQLVSAFEELFAHAGIQLNGEKPWDLQIHADEESIARRVLSGGTRAFGEAWMDKEIDCDDLTECLRRMLVNDPRRKLFSLYQSYPTARPLLREWIKQRAGDFLRQRLSNQQAKRYSESLAKGHYDIPPVLFKKMLDWRLVYSCGYWPAVGSLEDAQRAKLDLVCRKLGLMTGDTVLDVGCGYGSFLRYAAAEYGIRGLGVTISEKQAAIAKERTKHLPVWIQEIDYRELPDVELLGPFMYGDFDHLGSIGMFEHVGRANDTTFMRIIRNALKPGGMMLLHSIIHYQRPWITDPWMDTYIWPVGEIPEKERMYRMVRKYFTVLDMHDFDAESDICNYGRTICNWARRVIANREEICAAIDWNTLSHRVSDPDRFFRMWLFYLYGSAARFFAGRSSVQHILARKGRPGEEFMHTPIR